MAGEIIDSLVTQLEYDADTKVLDKADKKLKALEKQSEQTAKATDELTGKQIQLKVKLQATTEQEQKLRREQVKLRKEIKKAKKPTDDQRKALARVDKQLEDTTHSAQKYRNELGRVGIAQAKLSRQQRTTARQQTKLGGATKGARERAATAAASGGGGLAGVAAAAGPVGAALAGVAVAANAAGVAIHTVVETGARMESLRARLKTVEGGVGQAAQAFSLLRDIAKTTPFELEDVTNAYVRLRSLGLQPTERSLKAFGNVAAAQGKPIIDFVEAVADAATNEFERLKEFGIKASSQGEQVAFSFGGITTRVGKNAGEITKFLQGLGETKFAGAMADQMDTFAGLVSNLKDQWTGFLDQISQLGVLDEVKAIVKELSASMGDDLAPIIAEVMVSALRQLKDLLVFVRDGGDGLGETLAGLAETFEFVVTVIQPLLFVMGLVLDVLRFFIGLALKLHGALNGLIDLLGMVFDSLTTLLGPTKDTNTEWSLLGETWNTVSTFGRDLVATVVSLTDSLFGQAGSLDAVNAAVKTFKSLTGDGLAALSDQELQDLRQAGGDKGKAAETEIRKRIKAREASEKKEDQAQKRDKAAKTKKGRASLISSDFDQLNDRQLANFAADPNVSEKLRVKAAKEQSKRAKKRSKKGAAAGKKLAGATLIASIDKQFEKNARELAQAETARKLRAGTLDVGDAAGFETRRFKEIKAKQKEQFETSGRLPAGIAQDVRQIAAIPSIQDLAGRTSAPVISNTINKYDFHDNTFTAEVTGEFALSPTEVATIAAPQLRRGVQRLLGESIPNFRTQELR